MGYTASGGPKGLGVFNNTPQTTADLNQLIELIARVGNYLGPITEAERDALTGPALYAGLMAHNTTANTLEFYTGSGWLVVWRAPVNTSRFVRTTQNDSSVGTGTYIGLAEGTIVNPPPGQYLLIGRASVYANGSNVVGRVYLEWQIGGGAITREEARWDLPNVGASPVSATVHRVITHTSGNLRVAVGYRRDSGTFAVTGQASGETVVTATYLGPGV